MTENIKQETANAGPKVQEWKPYFWKPWEERHLSKEESAERTPKITVIGATCYKNYTSPEKRSSQKEDTSDNVRGDLAQETIANLVLKEGYNVSVIDAGSSQDFENFLKLNAREQTIFWYKRYYGLESYSSCLKSLAGRFIYDKQKTKGYSTARIQSMRLAINDWRSWQWDTLVQMELEKVDMVSQFAKLSKPILIGEADITIPDRGLRSKIAGDKEDNFRGYPPEQAILERIQNIRIHRELKDAGLWEGDAVLDLLGGTRAMAHIPTLIRLFGEACLVPRSSDFYGLIDPDKYLNAVYSPIYLGLFLRYKVKSVNVNYTHPEKQTKLEERDPEYSAKRIGQFIDVCGGSTLLIRYLGKKVNEGGTKEFSQEEFLDHIKREHPD